MGRGSPPSLKRSFVALAKLGYYEMLTLVALSALFWLASLPLFTLGAALLALFEVIGSVYADGTPGGELDRVRLFWRSVRENFVRGLPLSAIVLFAFANTYWYFAIALSGQVEYYLVGGLIGLYACLLAVLFAFRTANLMTRERTDWRPAVRAATRSWLDHLDFTVLQIGAVIVPLIASLAFPALLLFLLPGALALFDFVAYEELSGTDPRTVLDRYGTGP